MRPLFQPALEDLWEGIIEVARTLSKRDLSEEQESRAWRNFPLEHWERKRIRYFQRYFLIALIQDSVSYLSPFLIFPNSIEKDCFHQIPHPGGKDLENLDEVEEAGLGPKKISRNVVNMPSVIEHGYETQNLVAV